MNKIKVIGLENVEIESNFIKKIAIDYFIEWDIYKLLIIGNNTEKIFYKFNPPLHPQKENIIQVVKLFIKEVEEKEKIIEFKNKLESKYEIKGTTEKRGKI